MTDSKLTSDQWRFLETYLSVTNPNSSKNAGTLRGDKTQSDIRSLADLAQSMEYLVFAVRFHEGRNKVLEDILENETTTQLLSWSDNLSSEEISDLLPAYVTALKAVETLEKQMDAFIGDNEMFRLDIEAALGTWAGMSRKTALWFGQFLAKTRPSPPVDPVDPETLARSLQPFLARKPLAEVDVTNLTGIVATNTTDANKPGGAKRKVAAPLDILDTQSRIALYGTDNFDVNVTEDIAGTGGIRLITAQRNDDRSMEVEITGEILPGLLEDRVGLEAAGFFKYKTLEEDGRLRMHIEGDSNARWERLHLWGPGFGDEAGAGIYLGPRDINQIYQNRGIEKLIRHLGKLVLPLRDHGYRLMCTASVVTWPEPSPEGFFVERVFRRVEYELTLTTPGSNCTARAGLEMLTDPQNYNEGARLQTTVWGGGADWHDMFILIPETLPGVSG